MKYCEKYENMHLIELSLSELDSMCKILQRVSTIHECELYARIGFDLEDVLFCFNKLSQDRISNPEVNEIVIKISKKEFYIIRQSFNEVCNGLVISSYEESFGASRLDLVTMFGKWKTFKENL
jgi:hypothetical protein